MLTNYVVGIGASAGGLEAINELFDNMPSNTGFAFIIVQHLSPDHKSLMAGLLAKHTEMQVYEAVEDMVVKPDSIYLIPARKTLTLKNGKLKLEEKIRDHQPNTAIDIFFESLARDKAEKAIGIILSGTGTDGTKGIQAIKGSGGVITVQDPASAQFDGMPNSAIASGFADLILSPDMIPEELLEFIKEAPLLRSFNALSMQQEECLHEILELIHKVTAHDFSNYKRPTINRRLAKRMAELNIQSIDAYCIYLRAHADEVRELSKEFLLHVTRFFRDPEAFELLKATAIPDILEKKEAGHSVKVWTAACSTGEEAYAIAMLFEECMEAAHMHDRDIKIFASDISQEVIDYASRGFYTEDQVAMVSPERLKRFFIKEPKGYRISPAIRRMIVFARHDISKDPPFSKIDLLSCRNMLIYMNPILQRSILQKMHFSINDDGYLFLGPSENIGILKEVMQEVDKKWKIFRCVSKSKVADMESFPNPAGIVSGLPSIPAAKSRNALNSLADIFRETLLEEYQFAGIFIDSNFEVKQAIGHFSRFMDFPENTFNFNLLKLVPPDLSVMLSTGIRKAIKEGGPVVMSHTRFHTGSEERVATIIIKPYLTQKTYMQPFLFIVLKEEAAEVKKTSIPMVSAGEYTTERVKELEQELVDTKENLQALLEEVESSNEELQSSNEEIISSNEELQSTNEELQSLNEELHTVNAEHQQKIKELIELNDDFNNYFQNSDIGQILVDRKLVIRKFTPAAIRQVNLIPGDVGRSIIDISTNTGNLNFINEIKSVLQTGQVLEKETPMEGDKTFQMRIAPYLRQDKTVDGAVISFFDITEVKKLSSLLEGVFNASGAGIVSLLAIRGEEQVITDFMFIAANKAAASLMQTSGSLISRLYKELSEQEDPFVFNTYVKIVETGQPANFEYFDQKTVRWFEVNGVKMMDGLVITFSDITERKHSSERLEKGYADLQLILGQLEHTNYKLQQSNLDLLQFASVASHDLKEPLRKIQAFGNLLSAQIKDKLDASESQYLAKMIGASGRMETLIDNILILSRLSESDKPHADVNLEEVVRQIIDDLEISIRDKNVQITLTSLPVVKGISGQMHQLFQNLISNAIKFNNNKPEIRIGEEPLTDEWRAAFDVKPEDYHCIVIRDNGIGFDEKFSQKIFGVFQRLDPTHFAGTGIGLAIVKKIVDNHKGFIKAFSEPGKGSRFIILLPK